MRDALDGGPLSRPDLSSALHDRLPPELRPWCAGCKVDHVAESLFRWAGVSVPVALRREGRTTMCEALTVEGDPGAARLELTRRYLRGFAPTTPRQFAEWSGLSTRETGAVWDELADELHPVRVEGRRAFVAADAADDLASVEPVSGTRLLPPGDPYLTARDRDVLVPDKASRSALWPALHPPGAVLVDGELIGTWKRRRGARGRSDMTIEPWRRLGRPHRAAVEREAELVDAASGSPSDVRWLS
jgi:hypothetical protein